MPTRGQLIDNLDNVQKYCLKVVSILITKYFVDRCRRVDRSCKTGMDPGGDGNNRVPSTWECAPSYRWPDTLVAGQLRER